MHDFVRKPKNWAGLFIVITLLFALLYSFFTATNANLPSYVAPNLSANPSETPAANLKTAQYEDSELKLKMEVPAEWTRLIRDGHTTFVNPADASALQFIVTDYQPTLNSITEGTVSLDVQGVGGVLGGFAQYDASSYLAIYEIETVDYFEYTTWDLNTCVRVSLQIPAQRYQDYYDIAVYLFDTLSWNKPNPIPDGLTLFYSSFGNFEFGVPVDWSESIVNGSYVATSPDSGATIVCSVTESTSDLSGFNELDYTNVVSQSRPQHLRTSWNKSDNTLSSTASYQKNGEPWQFIHSVYFSGSYLYEFSLDCPQSSYEADNTLFLTAVMLFRLF